MSKNINIFGNGGFSREVFGILKRRGESPYVEAFVDINKGNPIYDIPVVDEKSYNKDNLAVVSIGNPTLRKRVVDKILKNNPYTIFPTIIDPRVIFINEETISIEMGCIICAGVVITCDVKLGMFTHLNLNTTVGHDCELGNFFTSAPSVNLSGYTITGESVYFGTGSGCKEHINICENVVIGAGAMVVKNINMPGVYIGVPATRRV